MPAVEIHTYADAIDNLDEFVGPHGTSTSQRQLRLCIQSAYRELTQAHDWSFLQVNGRIHLKEAENTGTCVYDHTGGSSERLLTLTGATWPTWIADGSIQFGGVVSDIEASVTTTTATLDATMNPGEDVESGKFTLYPRWYRLPADFISFTAPMETTAWRLGQYVTPTEMAQFDRYRPSTGDIQHYTVAPVPDLYGVMGLFVHPASNADETIDFVYKRRPRQLRYAGLDPNDFAGTIAGLAAAITGSSTAFESSMAGSILRIGGTTKRPTGIEGLNPWVEQRSIKSVASTTAMTLDASVTAYSGSWSGKKYTITDPLDLDVVAYDAFLRLCEKHAANMMDLKGKQGIAQEATNALAIAKGGDARVRQRRFAGGGTVVGTRMAHTSRSTRVETGV